MRAAEQSIMLPRYSECLRICSLRPEIYPPAPGSFNVGISRCFQLSEISWGEIFLTMGL